MLLTNRELKFRFYSVLKNEDAPPFLSDSLLVAADGLGGSGSTVHRIDYGKYDDFRAEILNAAFGDMVGAPRAAMNGYISELIEAMADGIGDTSALWASRICIARFIYALISDGRFSPEEMRRSDVRAALSDFVKSGLLSVAERFGFESGRISGQILLPTTLTAIRTRELENTVRAEVMWVGDSRAYAFTADGLRLLSRDDEDESGSITNIFDGREGRRARINYRVYQIPKPCMLMTVSDGVFDPFDPNDSLGVEHIFLSAIAESTGPIDLAARLKDIYDKIHGDDASVSLKAFGFSSFESIKEAYAPRKEYISSVYKRLNEMKTSLEVINSNDDDIGSYIRQRSKDKYARISQLLIEKYESGESDIILESSLFGKVLDGACENAGEADSAPDSEAEDKVYGAIYRSTVENPKILGSYLITRGRDERECTLIGRALKKADAVVKARVEYEEKAQAYAEHLEKRAEIRASIAEMIELLGKEIDRIAAESDKSRLALFEAAIEKCNQLNYRRSFWQRFLIQYDFERVAEKTVRLSPDENKLFSEANANTRVLIIRRNELFIKSNGKTACAKEYECALSALLDYIREGRSPRNFFIPELSEKMILLIGGSARKQSPIELKTLALKELLSEREGEVIEAIHDALAENPQATSAVDSCYNATRLDTFRQYHRMKSLPRDKVLDLEGELKALSEGYLSLRPIIA